MPLEIIRDDIVHVKADAIVNTTGSHPGIGAGTDAGVHLKAGPELLEARKQLGRIRTGDAAITPGFGLDAHYVIHTVAPVWRGGLLGEEKLLRRCYDASLALALEKGCRTMAFPLIGAGNRGFPTEKAMQTAMSAIQDFLMEHEMTVYLVVFDRNAFRLSEKLHRDIASYIDEHYVFTKSLTQYGLEDLCTAPPKEATRQLHKQMQRRRFAEETELLEKKPFAVAESAPRPTARPVPASLSLKELLRKTDAGFSETLLKLIDRTGKKDSQIYSKAYVSRQHFSKIKNNPDYKPTKATAIAFAIALELNLEETKDLIGRAGFTLTNSSKFDVIITYFISRGNYNMMDINAALYEFDQSVLGAP